MDNAASIAAEIGRQVAPGVVCPAFPIYLHGEVGRGKTGIAAVLYRVARSPIWRRADTCLLDLSTGRNSGEYATEIRKVKECSLLVLDDLGVRSPSEGMFHMLFDILEMRKARPTVITTNHSPESLASVYRDDRIYSRLRRATVIEIVGTDRRDVECGVGI